MVKKEFIELYYNENNTSSREEAKKQVDMFLKTMEKALCRMRQSFSGDLELLLLKQFKRKIQ